ncbi:hypothetical protein [Lentzea tibetensis]|uniref:hypothetical protein n=1 Tax=Lentzea tibetensis TaxID=2591470 RepID=UPI0016460402|nr:hypothetical protein [Lentzea tibetensis]
MAVRPALRCLTHDLALLIPTADVALDEIEHPLLAKAPFNSVNLLGCANASCDPVYVW